MMKKFLLLIPTILIICLSAKAETFGNIQRPMQTPISNSGRLFSIEETKPYNSLEKSNYTNQAIMSIESKHSLRNLETPQTEIEPQIESKRGFKSLFKGFVVEW